jgi:hypothetical protein
VVPTSAAATNRVVSTASIAAAANGTTINQHVTTINNSPGGNLAGDVQFYKDGKFAADSDFKYDTVSDNLTLNGGLITSNLTVGQYTNLGWPNKITILGGTAGQSLLADGNGRLRWGTGSTGTYGDTNVASYLISYTGNLASGNLLVTGKSNLGAVSNVAITGGNAGSLLSTDGNGNLSWTSNTSNLTINSIQNGNSVVTLNTNSNVNFTVGGNANVMTVTDAGAIANVFTSNNFILGNATTTISTNRWLDAVTMTTNPTVLFTAANTVSSVDVHITADDGTSKQITKMLSVTKGANTSYSQYGNVTIGTEMASFYMDQSGGLVRVIATPSSSSRVDYRLVVTLYN